MAADRIPVTVVAGGSRTGKSRLVGQLRAECPPGQRWAFLNNSLACGAEQGRLAAGGPSLPGQDYFHVAGGCACCLAGPAFRTALVRLLRAATWQRLHIEIDPAGHPHAVVDQLRTPPFDRYLRLTQLLLTLDEKNLDRPGLDLPAADLLAPEGRLGRLGWATDFLLRAIETGSRGTGGTAGAAPSFADFLEGAPPWPRRERVAGRRAMQAGSGLPARLPGWRVFSALAPAAISAGFDIFRQWPAGTVAARRPFQQLLCELAAEPGVTGFQALMRTPRAWYRWRFGRGCGAGPLAFDEGAQIVESETAWRIDSRLCVWLGAGARTSAVQARVGELYRSVLGSGLHHPAPWHPALRHPALPHPALRRYVTPDV